MNPFVATAIAFVVGLAIARAEPGGSPESAAQPTTPVQGYDDLSTKSKRIIFKRASQIYRMPDGSLLDVHQYYETIDAFGKAYVHRTTRRQRRSGNIVYNGEVISSRWEVREPEIARAFRLGYRLSRPYIMPDRNIRASQGAIDPLAFSISTSRIPVIFLDDSKADVITKSLTHPHYSLVTREWGNSTYSMNVWPLNDWALRVNSSEFVVKTTTNKQIRHDYLFGKFVLWPSPEIVHPKTGMPALETPQGTSIWNQSANTPVLTETGRQFLNEAVSKGVIRPDRCVYLCLSVNSLSADELHDEMAAGYQLIEWTWKYDRRNEMVVWSRNTVDLQYRKTRPRKP